MESISMAMSFADRFPVPLKNMCSMKCDIPPIAGGSCRDPTFTHTPMDTERDFGRVSDTTRTPLERVSFLYIARSPAATKSRCRLRVAGYGFETNGRPHRTTRNISFVVIFPSDCGRPRHGAARPVPG